MKWIIRDTKYPFLDSCKCGMFHHHHYTNLQFLFSEEVLSSVAWLN